jgi:hypothetical protein
MKNDRRTSYAADERATLRANQLRCCLLPAARYLLPAANAGTDRVAFRGSANDFESDSLWVEPACAVMTFAAGSG